MSTTQLVALLLAIIGLSCAAEYSSDKRSPLGTMRFGKRSLATYDDDNSIADAAYFNYDKREAADNGEDSIDRNIRSPLGTMRFGKRSDGAPLGTMRFGKRNPLGTMRFGKRTPLGTMRFGK